MLDEGFDSSFAPDSPQQSKQLSTRNLLLPEPNPIASHSDNSLIQIHNKLIPIQNRHQQQQLIYLKHPLPTNSHQLKYHYNGYFQTIKQYNQDNQIQITNQPSFNSQFQSANLFAVYISQPNQYDLILQDDTNSNGYSQWFYFIIQNIPLLPLTLNFINMSKHYHPLSLSKEFTIYIQYEHQIWQPLQNATILQSQSQYVKQRFYAQSRPLQKMTIEFTPSQSTFKLALTNPYTINDLNMYLKDNAIQETILTYTACGQPIKMLQFGSSNDDAVVLIARQHPGETVSSFICQGFLQALLQNSLPNHHVIVIPMINPDGVEQGNFRCDFNGMDLNRSWHKPNKVTQAHLIVIKKFLSSILQSGRNIKCFIDLHGHSKDLNSFMYGCRGSQDPVACRILPNIMSQVSKYFDLKKCTFSLEPCKLKTARAYVFKLVERYAQRTIGNSKNLETIHNIFTLETSFFGYVEEGKYKQFKTEDLLQIGHDLLNSLNIYYTDCQAVIQIKNQLEKNRQEYISQDIANNKDNGEEESDSDPEGGQIRQIDLEKTLGKQNKTKQKLKYKITTAGSNKNTTDNEYHRQLSVITKKDSYNIKQIPRKYSVQTSTRRENRYAMQNSFNLTQLIQQPRLSSDSQINRSKIFQTQQSSNYENNCVEINFPQKIQNNPPPYRHIKNYFDNSINEQSKSIKVQESRNHSCNNACYPQIKRQQINAIWLQDQNKFKDFRDNHLIFQVNHKVMRKNTYQIKKQ